MKENFAEVDGAALLAKLDAMPILTWNYKAQEDSIRHMGPMAQDLYAAFGLGASERHINTVDADGVALAGVQALYHLSQDKDKQLAKLQALLEEQKKELDDQRALIEKLLQKFQAELAVVKAQLTRRDDVQTAALKLEE